MPTDDEYESNLVADITTRDDRRMTATSKGLKGFRIRAKRTRPLAVVS